MSPDDDSPAPHTDVRPAGGRLRGLPELPDDGIWVEINGAVAITGVPATQITSHLAKHGPKRNPFPGPLRVLGRTFWPMLVLEAWAERERELAEPSVSPHLYHVASE